MSKYFAGSRNEVISRMASYAIRDQETLIDALTPRWGDPDEETAEAIKSAEENIKDFKLIVSSLRG